MKTTHENLKSFLHLKAVEEKKMPSKVEKTI